MGRTLLDRIRRLLGMSAGRRRFLLDLLPRGSHGAEIGVWKGNFSAAVLKRVRPSRFHLIDPWAWSGDDLYKDAWYGQGLSGNQGAMDAIYEGVLRRFAGPIREGIVEVHRRPSTEAAASIADGSLDWVYIDGNHLYEFVKQDLDAYFPKVKSGGIISGDDYGIEGWWKDGVTRGVDEFVARGAVQPIAFRNRQFVLRKT
jgi:hypothetical protein